MVKHIPLIFIPTFLWSIFISIFLWANLDGTIFPVAKDFDFAIVEPYYNNMDQTLLSFDINKGRDCRFLRVDWYYGDRSSNGPLVVSRFVDSPVIRTTGPLEIQNLLVNLPPSEVLNNSHAYVIHDCYDSDNLLDNLLFWQTRTAIYDSATYNDSPKNNIMTSTNILNRPFLD